MIIDYLYYIYNIYVNIVIEVIENSYKNKYKYII